MNHFTIRLIMMWTSMAHHTSQETGTGLQLKNSGTKCAPKIGTSVMWHGAQNSKLVIRGWQERSTYSTDFFHMTRKVGTVLLWTSLRLPVVGLVVRICVFGIRNGKVINIYGWTEQKSNNNNLVTITLCLIFVAHCIIYMTDAALAYHMLTYHPYKVRSKLGAKIAGW